jgi:hypothetical protein
MKVLLLSSLFLVLTNTAFAQNTKGDKPTSSREARFKKSQRKEKPKRVKSKRSSGLRAYKPRKQSRGGERAGKPFMTPLNDSPGEKGARTYRQQGRFVNNRSVSGKFSGRRRANERYVNNRSESGKYSGSRGTFSQRRVTARSSSGSIRNVYPQSGRFVNHSSSVQKPPKKRRIVPRTGTRSYIARKNPNAWRRFPSHGPGKEKAYTKDIAGKPLRTKNFESQRPGIVNAPRGTRRSASGNVKRSAPRSNGFAGVRSRSGRNVYPQTGKYVNNAGRKPRTVERPQSNAGALTKLNRLQSANDRRRPRRTKVTPRSASGSYIARRSPNTWAHFPRPKRKGERATTKDLAGHPLEKRNYETPRPEVIIAPKNYGSKKRIGDRPYQTKGKKYSSATRPGKAWLGDVTGRNVRGRNYRSKIPSIGYPSLPIRPKLRAKGIDKYQGNIRGRKGFRDQGGRYTGSLKTRRAPKGGGSITARWNNDGKPILGKQPGVGMFGLARYRGFIKGGKPVKGGGSVSGRLWNNQGRAVASKVPGIGAKGIDLFRGNIRGRKGFAAQGEEYTGNIKSRRPLKRGGSVSGKLWNNGQRAVSGKVPGIGAKGIDRFQGNIRGRKGFAPQGEEFTGNIKARRPLKGGGSVSGKLWNNNQRAVAGKVPGIGAKGIDVFTGNIKARKLPKGGGSVSGKLWNNRERAIAGKTPGIGAKGIDLYRGNIRGRKGFAPQGEEYTGDIKAKKPLKGGGSVSGKLWNNKNRPIPGKEPGIGAKGVDLYAGNVKARPKGPSANDKKVSGFPGKIKKFELHPGYNNQGEEFTGTIKAKRKYVQNPNAAAASLKKHRPGKSTYETDGLQVRVRQPLHGLRKNAPEGALAGLKPRKASIKASTYSRVMKQRWDYIKNPNAADASLKIREPGRAFARSTDYQGNIKMKKFDLFGRRDLHPDAKFVKTNKNNVPNEKGVVTNFRLWWARLFKKNDNQPQHLKDKTGKPRYDKREAGLWYD